jgi:hypothetical protein
VKIDGYDEAVAAVQANTSPRAQHMARLEAYVEGRQYDGRPSFWNDAVPLHERAPCIVYPVAKNAIGSNCDLVLGEGRFPSVTTCEEGDEDVDDEAGEDGAERAAGTHEVLDALLVRLQKVSRFRAAARDVFSAAQGCGAAVGLFGVRNLRPVVETTKARWCEPTLNADGEVERLVIEYPYLETYKERGTWKARARMYRREIDQARDVTMLPADISSSQVDIAWGPDPKAAISHNLGFCPVVWYPFMRGVSVVGDVDGTAIHDELLDEIDALNFALSQRHRAARYCGDPQWTECGVEQGFNPSESGRQPLVAATAQGGRASSDNPVRGSYVDTSRRGGGGARKKGPGCVWQYPDAATKVQMHALPAGALDALDEDARDLRVKLMESLSVVLLDPEDLRGASQISGKSLQAIRRRQIERCSQFREDFGDKWLRPGLLMLLRIAHVYARARRPLRVRGFDTAEGALRALDVAEAHDGLVAA